MFSPKEVRHVIRYLPSALSSCAYYSNNVLRTSYSSLFLRLAAPAGNAPSDIPIGLATPFGLQQFARNLSVAFKRCVQEWEDADSFDLPEVHLSTVPYQESTAWLFFIALM